MIKLTAKKKKWFEFPQDPSGEAKVEILHLKHGDIRRIEAEVNQVVGKVVDDEIVTEIRPNGRLRPLKILWACVTGLEGFEDVDGKPLACTKENIAKIDNDFDWFYDQVEKFRAELAKEAEDEGELEKN